MLLLLWSCFLPNLVKFVVSQRGPVCELKSNFTTQNHKIKVCFAGNPPNDIELNYQTSDVLPPSWQVNTGCDVTNFTSLQSGSRCREHTFTCSEHVRVFKYNLTSGSNSLCNGLRNVGPNELEVRVVLRVLLLRVELNITVPYEVPRSWDRLTVGCNLVDGDECLNHFSCKLKDEPQEIGAMNIRSNWLHYYCNRRSSTIEVVLSAYLHAYDKKVLVGQVNLPNWLKPILREQPEVVEISSNAINYSLLVTNRPELPRFTFLLWCASTHGAFCDGNSIYSPGSPFGALQTKVYYSIPKPYPGSRYRIFVRRRLVTGFSGTWVSDTIVHPPKPPKLVTVSLMRLDESRFEARVKVEVQLRNHSFQTHARVITKNSTHVIQSGKFEIFGKKDQVYFITFHVDPGQIYVLGVRTIRGDVEGSEANFSTNLVQRSGLVYSNELLIWPAPTTPSTKKIQPSPSTTLPNSKIASPPTKKTETSLSTTLPSSKTVLPTDAALPSTRTVAFGSTSNPLTSSPTTGQTGFSDYWVYFLLPWTVPVITLAACIIFRVVQNHKKARVAHSGTGTSTKAKEQVPIGNNLNTLFVVKPNVLKHSPVGSDYLVVDTNKMLDLVPVH